MLVLFENFFTFSNKMLNICIRVLIYFVNSKRLTKGLMKSHYGKKNLQCKKGKKKKSKMLAVERNAKEKKKWKYLK